MGAWSPDSKSHVAHMDGDDFYGSEQSHVVPFDIKESSTHKDAGVVRIEFVGQDGSTKILKNKTPLQPGEVIDASRMDVEALRQFYKQEIDDAKEKGVLFSLHLKATMMKVSDPIMFGHCVEVFYRDTFAKHADFVKEHSVDATKGLGDFYAKLEACGSDELKEQISNELEECLKNCDHVRPPLAMVDSDRGVTNLHVPSDIIIDASMPAALRESGKMWGPDGELADTKYVIPDRSYATSYKKVVEHCIEHGAFDPSTMGAVSNVGLMAQKAQEYGSHDKTFEAPAAGSIRVVARDTGEVCFRRLCGRVDGVEAGTPSHRWPQRERSYTPYAIDAMPRAGPHGTQRKAGRHLAHVPDQGLADPGLGAPRRRESARDRVAGHLLARCDAGPRRQPHPESGDVPQGPRHDGPRHPHHGP